MRSLILFRDVSENLKQSLDPFDRRKSSTLILSLFDSKKLVKNFPGFYLKILSRESRLLLIVGVVQHISRDFREVCERKFEKNSRNPRGRAKHKEKWTIYGESWTKIQKQYVFACCRWSGHCCIRARSKAFILRHGVWSLTLGSDRFAATLLAILWTTRYINESVELIINHLCYSLLALLPINWNNDVIISIIIDISSCTHGTPKIIIDSISCDHESCYERI